jgi:AcrR family transcriptional regulator
MTVKKRKPSLPQPRRGRGRAAAFEARRQEVIDAAWNVMVRDGIDGLSIRSLAHELGTTTGIVTHYFRDKSDLLLIALESVAVRAKAAYAQAVEGYESVERLYRLACAALPLDKAAQERITVWHAFVGHAIGKPALLEAHREREESWREFIRAELQMLGRSGLLRPHLDLPMEASSLIAFLDGIGLAWMIHPERFKPKQQKYLVQRYLGVLLKNPDLDFKIR